MKSLSQIVTVLLILLAFSCSKEMIITNTSVDQSNDLQTRSVKREESSQYLVTQEMALYYFSSIKGKENSIIKSIEVLEHAGVVCLYIINYDNGWMAIPSDMRVQPILGENDHTCLYPQENDNPGLKGWLEINVRNIYNIKSNGLAKYDTNIVKMWISIKQIIEDSQRSIDPEEATWVKVPFVQTQTTYYANVDRLVSTHWGQKSPWNCTLPIIPNNTNSDRFATGCVATAVSQIMYYYHYHSSYPNDFFQTITPTISSTTSDGGYKLSLTKNGYSMYSPRWANMPLTQNGSTYFNDVSDLMMLVGVKMNATYYPSQMTSTPLAFTSHLLACNISSQLGYYDYTTVKNNLINGNPVIVTADQEPPYGLGHVWIIDGCHDSVTTTNYYSIYYQFVPGTLYPTGSQYLTDNDVYTIYPNAFDGMSILETTNSYQTHYLRMNYGWADYADYGIYSITGSDWEEGLNYNIMMFYNLSPGQLGNS